VGARITGEAEGEEASKVRSAGVTAEGGKGSEAGGRAPWGCDVDCCAWAGLAGSVGVLSAAGGWSNFGGGRGSSESSQGETGSRVGVQGRVSNAIGGVC
jgi:hypothetical protein